MFIHELRCESIRFGEGVRRKGGAEKVTDWVEGDSLRTTTSSVHTPRDDTRSLNCDTHNVSRRPLPPGQVRDCRRWTLHELVTERRDPEPRE